jgi:hypothetical protein
VLYEGQYMGKMIYSLTILVENVKGRRPLGRPRCKWEDNIKINIKVIGHERMG